jgi:hypothetical protein
MKTENKKVGRPKGPEKEMFRAYVEPWQKLILETQMEKFRSGATRLVGSGGFLANPSHSEGSRGYLVAKEEEEGLKEKRRLEGIILEQAATIERLEEASRVVARKGIVVEDESVEAARLREEVALLRNKLREYESMYG